MNTTSLLKHLTLRLQYGAFAARLVFKCCNKCKYVAFKSCLFDRPPYKRESASLFWHLATKLKVSSNYIAASVNTDYNEALIVLKSTKRGKFQLHFLRLNDVTIH